MSDTTILDKIYDYIKSQPRCTHDGKGDPCLLCILAEKRRPKMTGLDKVIDGFEEMGRGEDMSAMREIAKGKPFASYTGQMLGSTLGHMLDDGWTAEEVEKLCGALARYIVEQTKATKEGQR